jgi:hypothetical protein
VEHDDRIWWGEHENVGHMHILVRVDVNGVEVNRYNPVHTQIGQHKHERAFRVFVLTENKHTKSRMPSLQEHA